MVKPTTSTFDDDFRRFESDWTLTFDMQLSPLRCHGACLPPPSHRAIHSPFHTHAPNLTTHHPSFFKTLIDHEVTVELKNDIQIRGVLKSVDQYLNIKLDNIQVLEEIKYPHMVSPSNPSNLPMCRPASDPSCEPDD